jgi:hypothetical protein
VYFNESNPNGCTIGSGFASDLSGDPDNIVSPIFMVERGDCSFVTMARNVERAGGALALIMDTFDEDIKDLILSDDGSGAGI